MDIGCGTGTFALLLADRGVEVVRRLPGSRVVDEVRDAPDRRGRELVFGASRPE